MAVYVYLVYREAREKSFQSADTNGEAGGHRRLAGHGGGDRFGPGFYSQSNLKYNDYRQEPLDMGAYSAPIDAFANGLGHLSMVLEPSFGPRDRAERDWLSFNKTTENVLQQLIDQYVDQTANFADEFKYFKYMLITEYVPGN